jgi:hypothetical protein
MTVSVGWNPTARYEDAEGRNPAEAIALSEEFFRAVVAQLG